MIGCTLNRSLRVVNVRFGSSIPVILLKATPNWGELGEVVTVKRGFARNYLIPRKMAVYATDVNRTIHCNINSAPVVPVAPSSTPSPLEEFAESNSLVFDRAANEGVLFGSVALADIKSSLSSNGIIVTNIDLESPIKTVGKHVIKIDGINVAIDVRGTLNK